MPESRNYVIWGSAGHAKVLANIVALLHGRVVALFDSDPDATSVLTDVPLYTGTKGFSYWHENERDDQEIFGLVAIGGALGRDRLELQDFLRAHGVRFESIVHPDASVCATAFLGAGTQILAGAIVASDARTGDGCIVNHRAAADHECRLGNGVHLAPGSILCGCVQIGNNVLVGAGAVVLPRLSIGDDTVVGAGSVVTKDLPAGVVAVGSPAQVIRKN